MTHPRFAVLDLPEPVEPADDDLPRFSYPRLEGREDDEDNEDDSEYDTPCSASSSQSSQPSGGLGRCGHADASGERLKLRSSPSMPVDVAGEPDGAGFFISVGLSIPVGLLFWSGVWAVL